MAKMALADCSGVDDAVIAKTPLRSIRHEAVCLSYGHSDGPTDNDRPPGRLFTVHKAFFLTGNFFLGFQLPITKLRTQALGLSIA